MKRSLIQTILYPLYIPCASFIDNNELQNEELWSNIIYSLSVSEGYKLPYWPRRSRVQYWYVYNEDAVRVIYIMLLCNSEFCNVIMYQAYIYAAPYMYIICSTITVNLHNKSTNKRDCERWKHCKHRLLVKSRNGSRCNKIGVSPSWADSNHFICQWNLLYVIC